MSTGIELIAAERQRQLTREGWTPEHDDTHNRSEMVVAACRYALHDASKPAALRAVARIWRWSSCWWKPKDPIRNLVRAGALIAAEIDRLQRAHTLQHVPGSGQARHGDEHDPATSAPDLSRLRAQIQQVIDGEHLSVNEVEHALSTLLTSQEKA